MLNGLEMSGEYKEGPSHVELSLLGSLEFSCDVQIADLVGVPYSNTHHEPRGSLATEHGNPKSTRGQGGGVRGHLEGLQSLRSNTYGISVSLPAKGAYDSN